MVLKGEKSWHTSSRSLNLEGQAGYIRDVEKNKNCLGTQGIFLKGNIVITQWSRLFHVLGKCNISIL
jgi:hypothetical protein